MSVLDDIRSGAEGAHGSFDDAKSQVNQASDEADSLEQSAAGHGWAGVAQAMTSARESLESAASAVDDALEAITDGLAHHAGITDEMSSDEVAALLAQVGDRLEAAGTAAAQAQSSLDDARSAAEQADAETLAQLVTSADEDLAKGRETLASALSDISSERADATSWGN